MRCWFRGKSRLADPAYREAVEVPEPRCAAHAVMEFRVPDPTNDPSLHLGSE
jgi:hypothetical protein